MPLLRLILIGSIVATTIACGNSPTAPTPPPIPQLTGQYTGTFTVASCVESGAAVGSNFCANLGSSGLHSFTPSQSGSALTGTIGIGTITVPVTGNVGSDQVVALSGSGPLANVATLTLNTWRGTLAGTALNGSMTFTVLTVTPAGSAVVQSSFSLFR